MAEVLNLNVEEKPRATPMVSPNRVQAADHGRNVWLVTSETGDHPEDFLEASYWANVSKDFRPFDHVEVRTDDGTYWAEFLVLASDRTWAKLHLLREARLALVDEVETSPEFKVLWKGPHKKFCVIRISDSSAVHEGEQEKGQAVLWLEGYLRTIGKPVGARA